jgi:PilZ domain-containing protein
MERQGQQNSVSTAAARDRRRAERIPFRIPMRVTINPRPGHESDRPRSAHVLAQDLSGTGLSIIYARHLSIGQQLEVDMPDGSRPVVVCRIESMNDGRYLVGCRFMDAETEAQPLEPS